MSTTDDLPSDCGSRDFVYRHQELLQPHDRALSHVPHLSPPARARLLPSLVAARPILIALVTALLALAVFRGFQIHITDITIHFGR